MSFLIYLLRLYVHYFFQVELTFLCFVTFFTFLCSPVYSFIRSFVRSFVRSFFWLFEQTVFKCSWRSSLLLDSQERKECKSNGLINISNFANKSQSCPKQLFQFVFEICQLLKPKIKMFLERNIGRMFLNLPIHLFFLSFHGFEIVKL